MGYMEVCRAGLFSGPAKSDLSLSQPPRGSATEAVERLEQARASSAHCLPPSATSAGQGEQSATRSAGGPGPHGRYGRDPGGARGGQRGCPPEPCPVSPLRAPAVSVVMGIPSVRREVHSYLTDTLHSLISELSPQEKEDSVIVVLIAEASGPGPGDTGTWRGRHTVTIHRKREIQRERHGEQGGQGHQQNCSLSFIANGSRQKVTQMNLCTPLWRHWLSGSPHPTLLTRLFSCNCDHGQAQPLISLGTQDRKSLTPIYGDI